MKKENSKKECSHLTGICIYDTYFSRMCASMRKAGET